MPAFDLILDTDDFERIGSELLDLVRQARARFILLVDKNGQLIASAGDVSGIDTTALASLTAGNVAATGGMAGLLGEEEFSVLFHEGRKGNIHISVLEGRLILMVIFDDRSTLGLIRLRVRKTSERLIALFRDIEEQSFSSARPAGSTQPLFPDITDDDIDKLFG